MLPTDAKARKDIPIYSGCVKYFPHALAAVAELSRIGNEQHNPGQPLHWAKEKSQDELDALMRHTFDFAIDPTHRDPDGVHPSVKRAWRALADLERLFDAGVNIFAVAPEAEDTCTENEEDGSQMDEPHPPTREELIDLEHSPAFLGHPVDRALDQFAQRIWSCDFGDVKQTVHAVAYMDGQHVYIEAPFINEEAAETAARQNVNQRPGVRCTVTNR